MEYNDDNTREIVYGFANKNTYTTTMYSYRDGYQLYCVITDANGYYIQTNTVILSMLSE